MNFPVSLCRMFALFLGATLLVAIHIGCDGRSLSSSTARELLQPRIAREYGLVVPKNAEFTWRPPPRYDSILLAESVGLVSAAHTTAMVQYYGMERRTIRKPDMGDKFTVSLTEKGKASEYWDGQGTSSEFFFLTAANTVDEILDITQDPEGQYLVLFSFVQNQTTLGKEIAAAAKASGQSWAVDGARYRGKATIVYDGFLKLHVLKKLYRSPWEREEWGESSWLEPNRTDG